jgi:hypothetical protein
MYRSPQNATERHYRNRTRTISESYYGTAVDYIFDDGDNVASVYFVQYTLKDASGRQNAMFFRQRLHSSHMEVK